MLVDHAPLTLLSCPSRCSPFPSPGVRAAVEEVLPSLRQQGIRVFLLGEERGSEGTEALSDKIRQASDQPLSPQLRAQVKATGPAAYFYTSGTTGERVEQAAPPKGSSMTRTCTFTLRYVPFTTLLSKATYNKYVRRKRKNNIAPWIQ